MTYLKSGLAGFHSISAARCICIIFAGAKASEPPIEQPTKSQLVVILRTAWALDLTLPRSVLARVDEVI